MDPGDDNVDGDMGDLVDTKNGHVGRAFLVVFASATATSVGSLVVFYPQLAQYATSNVLGASLGFATGVMLYVSLVDIYSKSIKGFLEEGHSEDAAFFFTTCSFFGGMGFMKILDVALHKFAKDSDFEAVEAGMEEMASRLGDGKGGSSSAIALDGNDSSLSNDHSPTHARGHRRKQQLQEQKISQQDEHLHAAPPITTIITESPARNKYPHDYSRIPTSSADASNNNTKVSNLSIPRIHQLLDMVDNGFETATNNISDAESNNVAATTMIPATAVNSPCELETQNALLKSRENQDNTASSPTPGRHSPPIISPPEYTVQLPQDSALLVDSSRYRLTGRGGGATTRSVITSGTTPDERKSLFTMGITTAMAIALHNFPEGLVTFVAYLEDPAVGVAMAIGIAMHNLPEGLCVSMPIFYATGRPWKAFFWGSVSGLSEPFGALIGFCVLKTSVSGNTYGTLFGFVSGMMVFISIDELLPMAFKFDPTGSTITITSIMGMMLVAISVLLFKLGDS